MKPLRRNTVVYRKIDYERSQFAPYGRISRILPDGKYEMLDTHKGVWQLTADEMVADDYKGCWATWPPSLRERFPVWRPMPSLRKLKQLCSQYEPNVWKKNRKRATNKNSENPMERR